MRKATLVAHSTGGIGALSYVIEHPRPAAARLAGMVLISTPLKGLGGARQTRLLRPLVSSGLIHEILRRPRLGARFVRTFFGEHPDASLTEFARSVMADSPRATKIEAAKAVLDFDFRDRMAGVEVPALVLCGTKDRSVKPEHAEQLAARMPRAQLGRLAEAGHMVVLERAGDLARQVGGFVADTAGRSAQL